MVLNKKHILVTSCGCHLYLNGIRADGYASIKRKGKMIGVHRAAWEDAYGPIPPGILVCHKCDIRCCVNKKHLFLGTHKGNTQDMIKKGRKPKPSESFTKVNVGKKFSKEHAAKIGAANARRVVKESTREKHRANAIKQNFGRCK